MNLSPLPCRQGEETRMSDSFAAYLLSSSIPSVQLAVFPLLDEMVATPWQFDLLWDQR